ncbi:MAG: pseudouridine synthase [Planctomycetota bacterium]
MLTSLEVPSALGGERLDHVLHQLVPDLSRSLARRLCECGAVAIDGVRAAASDRLRAGLTLVYRSELAPLSLALGMEVVYADPAMLVVHKPAGLAAHGGPLVDDSLAARLADAFPGEGVGLAHRLDREASGLCAVGRRREALAALARAIEAGQVERVYHAAVVGTPTQDEFTIDLPLRVLDEPRGDQPKTVVDHAHGGPARSDVRVLQRTKQAALVEVRLHSGKTHQIRAHLGAVGFPLLGDPRYGDPASNAMARESFGVRRLMLHAHRLALASPVDGRRLELTASHEPDFARMFRATLLPRRDRSGEQSAGKDS